MATPHTTALTLLVSRLISVVAWSFSHLRNHDKVRVDGQQNGPNKSVIILWLDAYTWAGSLGSWSCSSLFLQIWATMFFLRVQGLQDHLSTGKRNRVKQGLGRATYTWTIAIYRGHPSSVPFQFMHKLSIIFYFGVFVNGSPPSCAEHRTLHRHSQGYGGTLSAFHSKIARRRCWSHFDGVYTASWVVPEQQCWYNP